jgi:hypothetical protein
MIVSGGFSENERGIGFLKLAAGADSLQRPTAVSWSL